MNSEYIVFGRINGLCDDDSEIAIDIQIGRMNFIFFDKVLIVDFKNRSVAGWRRFQKRSFYRTKINRNKPFLDGYSRQTSCSVFPVRIYSGDETFLYCCGDKRLIVFYQERSPIFLCFPIWQTGLTYGSFFHLESKSVDYKLFPEQQSLRWSILDRGFRNEPHHRNQRVRPKHRMKISKYVSRCDIYLSEKSESFPFKRKQYLIFRDGKKVKIDKNEFLKRKNRVRLIYLLSSAGRGWSR